MSTQSLSTIRDSFFQDFGVMLCLPKNSRVDTKSQGDLPIDRATCSASNGAFTGRKMADDYIQMAESDLRRDLELLSEPEKADNTLYHLSSLISSMIQDLSLFMTAAIKCHDDSKNELRSKETLEFIRDELKQKFGDFAEVLGASVERITSFITTEQPQIVMSPPIDTWERYQTRISAMKDFLQKDWSELKNGAVARH